MENIKLNNKQREGYSICPLCDKILHYSRDDIVTTEYETGTFAVHLDCIENPRDE